MADLPQAIRGLLVEMIAEVPHLEVGVALSSGVDSTSVLLAALEAGKRPTALSFRLASRVSTDFVVAEENARRLGVPFRPVILPDDPEVLVADVKTLICIEGLTGKAAIECVWPFTYLLTEHVGIPALLTGSAADGHFGLSKKAMIHFREPLEKFDQFRRDYFASPDRAQTATVARLAARRGIQVLAPWRDQRMVDLLLGRSWDELNRPRQKEPVRSAFESEMRSLAKLPRHTNLQLGDSGIADHFTQLVRSSLNRGGHRSVVGVYNDVRRTCGR